MSAEAGHAPNRFYIDQNGNAHCNGAQVFDVNEVDSAPLLAALNVQPAALTVSQAAGSTNVCLVTFQVQNSRGQNVAAPIVLDVLLSDAPSGAGLTATSASGNVTAGASGVVLETMSAKKALRVQTDATGKFILSITDTAATGFYPVGNLPGFAPFVGPQTTTYGS